MHGLLTPAPASADTCRGPENRSRHPITDGNGVSSEHRLQRLRELLARLEQLPASPETERMLAEVRSRLVDVDTGVTPRAMLPVDRVPAPAAKAVAPTRAEHDRE